MRKNSSLNRLILVAAICLVAQIFFISCKLFPEYKKSKQLEYYNMGREPIGYPDDTFIFFGEEFFIHQKVTREKVEVLEKDCCGRDINRWVYNYTVEDIPVKIEGAKPYSLHPDPNWDIGERAVALIFKFPNGDMKSFWYYINKKLLVPVG